MTPTQRECGNGMERYLQALWRSIHVAVLRYSCGRRRNGTVRVRKLKWVELWAPPGEVRGGGESK